MQFTCKYKPVLFADSLHKSCIAYCEPTFPNHLRGEKKCRRQIRSQMLWLNTLLIYILLCTPLILRYRNWGLTLIKMVHWAPGLNLESVIILWRLPHFCQIFLAITSIQLYSWVHYPFTPQHQYESSPNCFLSFSLVSFKENLFNYPWWSFLSFCNLNVWFRGNIEKRN